MIFSSEVHTWCRPVDSHFSPVEQASWARQLPESPWYHLQPDQPRRRWGRGRSHARWYTSPIPGHVGNLGMRVLDTNNHMTVTWSRQSHDCYMSHMSQMTVTSYMSHMTVTSYMSHMTVTWQLHESHDSYMTITWKLHGSHDIPVSSLAEWASGWGRWSRG